MDLSRDYDDFPTGGLNRGKKSFLGRNSRILHFIMAGIQRSIPRGKVEEGGGWKGDFVVNIVSVSEALTGLSLSCLSK